MCLEPIEGGKSADLTGVVGQTVGSNQIRIGAIAGGNWALEGYSGVLSSRDTFPPPGGGQQGGGAISVQDKIRRGKGCLIQS